MRYPNFTEEKNLWEQGYEFVIGLDEAGRGPLAGPVVAASVAVFNSFGNKKHSDILKNIRMFSSMRDSKKLSEKQREYFYGILTNHKNIKWGVGVVSEKIIDKINILEATKLAMRKAVNSLRFKSEFLLIDGNFKLNNMRIPQKSIVRGDEKVFSISAAGIIAKVTRDKIMRKTHKKYPQYGFDRHKGYGTFEHMKNLQNFGSCKIHRKSFWQINNL